MPETMAAKAASMSSSEVSLRQDALAPAGVSSAPDSAGGASSWCAGSFVVAGGHRHGRPAVTFSMNSTDEVKINSAS